MRQLDIWKLTLSAILILLPPPPFPVRAGDQPIKLPVAIDWSTTSLLSINDDWSGVSGVEGFLGQNLTTQVGADPRTLLTTSVVAGDRDLIANQSNPNGLGTGGVAEFDGIADPTIALQGSSTADAPYLLLHLDTTGMAGVTVSYRLRDLDGSSDDAIQPVALQYRVGDGGNFINIPEAYVADATTGPGVATLETRVSAVLPPAAANQPLVQVRIITANALGNDEWVGIDDIVVATGGASRLLTIDDVTRAEGDAGVTVFGFTVRLSAPAGPEGVAFDIGTVDGTARVADGDYIQRQSGRQTIPPGSSAHTFEVTVNGDLRSESDEDFFVDLSAVSGAVLADGRGVGVIRNDDFALISIHDIQGAGSRSPLVGATVRTRGVVTGRKSTGFFMQEVTPDADPLTSEGVFVFSGSTPPSMAVAGNLVEVTGQVVEYVPSSDPSQPPLTQLTQPQVTLVLNSQPLPTPVALSVNLPSPSGSFDQLERLEGMRVAVPALTVCAPTQGAINEPSATAFSNGVFFGVVTGVGRPFREPGIQAPDSPPAGTIPPIPRFDNNPERIRVDSNELVGASLPDYAVGTVISGLTGPLDYAFRSYTLLPEPGLRPAAAGGAVAVAVAPPADDELTVATFNLQRLYDTTNDPAIGEPVLTAAAFANRLGKASRAIRDYLRAPDILGVVEVENLATLQALATRISDDAIAAGQPDPVYTALLIEGNDVGGIDVGFLVRTAPVIGTTPRVSVTAVAQELAASRFNNPDGSTDLLNDRPPLRLMATVNHPAGGSFAVTVIVNHLRSLGGVGDSSPGANGWASGGERVRAKRQRQAEDLARLVQSRQVANPTERIILVGDFNAFEFNDGFTDSLGTIAGQPSPDNQTVIPGDGADLVEPDLVNLSALTTAADRYSYSFDGNAQSLDHLLVNRAIVDATLARRVEHPRLNADFPETARNDAASPLRLSDHDPLVGYFRVAAFCASPLPALAYPSEVPVEAGGDATITPATTLLRPDLPATLAIYDRGTFTGEVAVDRNGTITVTSAAPIGDHRVVVRLTDGCGRTVEARLLLRVVTPYNGPGLAIPALTPAAAIRPGSILLFNSYSSAVDSRFDSTISLTNTHPQSPVSIRLFLVDGADGAVESRAFALTPNQTLSFRAGDQDPGVTGYILVVAVNDQGCPRNFNYLIGSARVNFGSGHAASLSAIGITALTDPEPLCLPGLSALTLRFDGAVYQKLPRTLAVNSLPSRVDGNQTLLVVNRLDGDLRSRIEPGGLLQGSLYNDLEARWDFTINSSTSQTRGILSSATFPLTTLRFENVVPAGRTGWIRLSTTSDTAISGAVFNLHQTGFNGGHNLHALTLTNTATLTIPIV